MDLGSIIGLCLSLGMVALGIIGGGVGMSYYTDIPSIFIVVGGSLGAMFTAYPLESMKNLGVLCGKVIHTQVNNDDQVIAQLVAFSERARREGLLALEDTLEDVEDQFIKDGMQLVVDGTDPELIKSILYNELEQIELRHKVGINFFETWGSLAPAFGMIGTLCGLIAMLANLNDTAGLAKGMATAMITTLYGSMLANVFVIPFGKKLALRSSTELLSKGIIVEGILSIQAGDNPRILKQKLIGFLPPAKRATVTDGD